MRIIRSHAFARWATVVVSILIVLAVVAIAGLTYLLVQREQERSLPTLRPITPSAVATRAPASPPPTLTSLPRGTPMPFLGSTPTDARISSPTATESSEPVPLPSRAPTSRGPTPLATLPTLAPTTASPVEGSGLHPTFEPTTMPCQDCHGEMRQGGN